MKFRYWLFLFLSFSLWLSSCSSAENGSQNKTPIPTVGLGQKDDLTPVPEGTSTEPESTATIPEQTPQAVEQVDLPEGQMLDTPLLLSDLFGQEVTRSGRKVAQVNGAVIDMVGGQMQYLSVLASTESGERTVLLPLQSFVVITGSAETESEGISGTPVIQLRLGPEVLAKAPAFDRARWLDSAGLPENWDRQVVDFWAAYGNEVPVTGKEDQGVAAAPVLIDSAVDGGISFPAMTRDEELLGTINNMILNKQGQVAFLLLRPGTRDTPEQTWIPVSWKSVAWSQANGAFVLQSSADAIEQAPRVESGSFPDTSVPGWDEEWQLYWEQHGPGAVPVETPAAEVGLHTTTLNALQQRQIQSIDETQAGQVADWVISTEGESQFAILQLDEGYIPVPWRLLDWQAQDAPVQLLQEAVVVQNAPVFEDLEMLDRQNNWQVQAADYWSDFIDLQNEALLPDLIMVRAGVLIGENVLGPKGGTLGTVEDLILLPEGQPPYLLLQSRDRYLAIPWIYFSYDLDTHQMIYLDDLQRLRDAPGVSDPQDFLFSSPVWDKEIRSYWGMQ